MATKSIRLYVLFVMTVLVHPALGSAGIQSIWQDLSFVTVEGNSVSVKLVNGGSEGNEEWKIETLEARINASTYRLDASVFRDYINPFLSEARLFTSIEAGDPGKSSIYLEMPITGYRDQSGELHDGIELREEYLFRIIFLDESAIRLEVLVLGSNKTMNLVQEKVVRHR